jgi:hypothetical protein
LKIFILNLGMSLMWTWSQNCPLSRLAGFKSLVSTLIN